MIKLFPTIVVLVLFSCRLGFSQEISGPVNLGLGLAIEEAWGVKGERTKIIFPPRRDSLLGAIVAFQPDGEIEILSRLPPSAFAPSMERRGGTVEDNLIVESRSAIVSKIITSDAGSDETIRIGIKAKELELMRAVSVQEDDFKKALADLEPFFAANATRNLYLASAVIRGRIRATLSWPNLPPQKIASKLDYFNLSQPNRWESTFVLETTGAFELGCQLDSLVYSPLNPAGARIAKVASVVQDLPPTAWEATQRMYGAPNQFDTVQVLFATDRRDMKNSPPAPAKQTSFWIYFVDYILLMKAWMAVWIVASVVWFVILNWWIKSHWYVIWGPTAVVGLVWIALALWYANQESSKAAAAPSDLTADRGVMTYGTCDVSIPHDHTMGELEKPFTKLLIEFEREDPSENVVFLRRSSPVVWSEFVKLVNDRLVESPEQETLVFIHGYNNTFEEAAKRTAQFAYDLRFAGPPILYSWPSQGTVAQYSVDSNEAEWSQPHFRDFLRDLLRDSTAKRVHLIAHSMGNRILVRSLVELAEDGVLDGPDCRIREIVLAAPDIDADVFRDELVPKFVKRKPRVTLYASSNDEALVASRSLMVNKHRRAGDADDGIVVVDGLESVDASRLDTSFDTHGYFAAYRSVISDLRDVIVNGLPPIKRGLDERKSGSMNYYVIPK